MCVERTANTNAPSARRSRCRVACQYLAAAFPLMEFCEVAMDSVFMLSTLHACTKRIYPVSAAKFTTCLILPWAASSGFAGYWHRLIRQRRRLMRRGDHQNDRPKNNDTGKNG